MNMIKTIKQQMQEQKDEIEKLKQENLLLRTEVQTVKDLFIQYINQQE
jgi:cell division protein FtsB